MPSTMSSSVPYRAREFRLGNFRNVYVAEILNSSGSWPAANGYWEVSDFSDSTFDLSVGAENSTSGHSTSSSTKTPICEVSDGSLDVETIFDLSVGAKNSTSGHSTSSGTKIHIWEVLDGSLDVESPSEPYVAEIPNSSGSWPAANGYWEVSDFSDSPSELYVPEIPNSSGTWPSASGDWEVSAISGIHASRAARTTGGCASCRRRARAPPACGCAAACR